MNLENQVCSLGLSKRLKELGVKQESIFYWCIGQNDSNAGLPVYYEIICAHRIEASFYYPKDKISAFSVAELGELFPYYNYEIIKSIRWIDFSCEHFEISFKCETEADARAKMLIYLLENKLMELPNEG